MSQFLRFTRFQSGLSRWYFRQFTMNILPDALYQLPKWHVFKRTAHLLLARSSHDAP
jgi:hypothetical protein